MIRTELFTGPAIAAHLPTLSAMRMAVFRAWPYLYDGSLPSEADTLSSFATSQTAGLVIAFDDDTPIGASTCVHMPEEDDHITLPFREAGSVISAKACCCRDIVALALACGFSSCARATPARCLASTPPRFARWFGRTRTG